jgi:hypothetical protein
MYIYIYINTCIYIYIYIYIYEPAWFCMATENAYRHMGADVNYASMCGHVCCSRHVYVCFDVCAHVCSSKYVYVGFHVNQNMFLHVSMWIKICMYVSILIKIVSMWIKICVCMLQC